MDIKENRGGVMKGKTAWNVFKYVLGAILVYALMPTLGMIVRLAEIVFREYAKNFTFGYTMF